MLRSILFLLLFLWSVNSNGQCSVVGYPDNYNWCYGDIDRALSRAAFASGLTDQIVNGDIAGYNKNVNILAKLNAAYISRVVSMWGVEYRMRPTEPFYAYAKQAIVDINNSYDCLKQRRPVIEAAILEHISTDVNNVSIPQYVLNVFQSDPDFILEGYTLGGNYNFDFNKI